ncbi:MAG TPA: threonine/serine dehydratase [Woeseiaceae bacterium]|nr:threonine/serine dehydratase [Woeseiaceae bacterium]
MHVPDYLDVVAAAERLSGKAVKTPLLRSAILDEITGAQVFVKAECLQHSGSFKFRGAFNRLVQLSEAEMSCGVVAWSSGNHAQGVAYVSKMLGVNATIVMPRDAPSIKIENTRRLGANIIFYDRASESREEIAHRISVEHGSTLVPSYDDANVIAGQGTVGLEIVQQLEVMNVELDLLLVCCGGGGLIAGTALAFKELSPGTKIFAVEPDGYDDHSRSLEAGRRLKNSGKARTLCDALLAPEPGAITWQINSQLLTRGLVVQDEEVLKAMRFALTELKIVAEPGGAVALAALLAGKAPARGKNIGVVISGGNVDDLVLEAALRTKTASE